MVPLVQQENASVRLLGSCLGASVRGTCSVERFGIEGRYMTGFGWGPVL